MRMVFDHSLELVKEGGDSVRVGGLQLTEKYLTTVISEYKTKDKVWRLK
jgi:hypothetical protein